MNRPTCATCPFWEPGPVYGYCQRHAPRPAVEAMVVRVEDDTETVNTFIHWPRTLDDEWCGEHPRFGVWIEAMRDEFEAEAKTDA